MPAAFARTTRALNTATAAPALAAWGVAGLLLLAWTGWFLAGQVTVYASSSRARLEVAAATQALSAGVAGRVQALRLRPGQAVQAGEVLVELDASTARLQLAEARALLAGLAGQLAALQSEMRLRQAVQGASASADEAAVQGAQARGEEASAAWAHASDQEARLRAEAAAGSVAAVDALAARAELQKLSAGREALAAEVRRLAAQGRERSAEQQAQAAALLRAAAALQTDVAAATQRAEGLLLAVEQHQLRAPVSGLVGDLAPLRVGEVVAAGQRFASIVPTSELMAVADFDPRTALGRIRAGQRAELRLDGFPWAQHGTLQARVRAVASELRDGLLRVEFTPAGDWPSGVTPQHGLTASVEVALESVSPATLVLRASGQALARPGAPGPAAVAP